jgi:HEPN domain-containing protein
MRNKFKSSDEWFLQAEYDIDTAETMFDGGRYMYAVFMSHLSIEKALKGLYAKVYENDPPRTHNLLYLIELIGTKSEFDIPDEFKDFFQVLNEKSVPTRYPNMLYDILKEYKKSNTKQFVSRGKKVLKWLKAKSDQL